MQEHKDLSHYFETNSELLNFILWEVQKFIGKFTTTQLVYAYNRMTVEDIAQEVLLKICRSTTEKVNKRYVRNAIRMVCIDLYRKKISESDKSKPTSYYDSIQEEFIDIDANEVTEEDTFRELHRDLQMKRFHMLDLKIIKYMREGYKHKEIMELIGMPKMTYYNALNRLKERHV